MWRLYFLVTSCILIFRTSAQEGYIKSWRCWGGNPSAPVNLFPHRESGPYTYVDNSQGTEPVRMTSIEYHADITGVEVRFFFLEKVDPTSIYKFRYIYELKHKAVTQGLQNINISFTVPSKARFGFAVDTNDQIPFPYRLNSNYTSQAQYYWTDSENRVLEFPTTNVGRLFMFRACSSEVFRDIDECQPNDGQGPCGQNCHNTDGSFYCTCNTGYRLHTDVLGCNDINECLANSGGCSHGCANTPGSVECSCPSWLELQPDRLTCRPPETGSTPGVTPSSPVPSPLTQRLCPSLYVRKITWPATNAGQIASQNCPIDGITAQATWTCGSRGQWEGHPDLSVCSSGAIRNIQNKINDPKTPVVDGTRELPVVSGQVRSGIDLLVIVDVMKNASDKLSEELESPRTAAADMAKAKQVVEDLVASANGVLGVESVWKELDPLDQRQAASSLLYSLEGAAQELGQTLLLNGVTSTEVTGTGNYIGYEVRRVPKTQSADLPQSPGLIRYTDDRVTIPAQVLQSVPGAAADVAVTLISYKNIEQFLPSLNTEKHLHTGIFAVSLVSSSATKPAAPLPSPIQLTFALYADANSTEVLECSFWTFLNQQTKSGVWLRQGCSLHARNLTHVTCECDHMTNFAVLLNTANVPIAEEHNLALTIITYSGLSLSLFCLLLSFLFLSCYRPASGNSKDRNIINKNIVACLFVAELLFLLAIAFKNSSVGCKVMAGILHYTFLAAFTWMFLEGFHLYYMLIKVFDTGRSRSVPYYLTGYGVPLVTVAVTLGISGGLYDWRGYGVIGEHCWLSTEHGMIWSFVGPLAFILFVNLIMLAVAVHQMCRHTRTVAKHTSTEISRSKEIKGYVSGAWVLVLLMGLTWATGFLYMHQQTETATVFAYVFTVLNCLQGFFIFLFYCLKNESVRKGHDRWVQKSKCLPAWYKAAVLKDDGSSYHASSSSNTKKERGKENGTPSQQTQKTSAGTVGNGNASFQTEGPIDTVDGMSQEEQVKKQGKVVPAVAVDIDDIVFDSAGTGNAQPTFLHTAYPANDVYGQTGFSDVVIKPGPEYDN